MRNDSAGGNWLEVQVIGRRMNRMGIGTRVAVYRPGMASQAAGLVGLQEITLNGGYACSRPAMSHFGLGKRSKCDVVVQFPPPANPTPLILRDVTANQVLKIAEPE
jgi:hypothetical protein